MPAPHEAALGSSTSELLDFSIFLNERSSNLDEKKGN